MKFLKFSVAVAAAALMVTPVTSALADTWRMAHKQTAESIEGRMFQAFADRIAERTGGEITVEVYPSEQLGKDDAILEQLQLGTVHLYPEGGAYLRKWVPDITFMSAPFLFDDREHWARFMASDLVDGWISQIEDEAGITVIGDQTLMVRGPYRVMVTAQPVGGLEDIEGLKLRMHPNELAAAAWRHLGAEVRTLAWTDVYESIGRGIVEAVNSPISLVESMRFHEVAPNIVRHNEYPQGIAFMANAQIWNDLSDETREQILAAYNEVAAEFAPMTAAIADEAIGRMMEAGVTYQEIDTGPILATMADFYAELDAQGELPEGFVATVQATR
ncbi:MAG: TRAP transporter substrate-binding protein [Devosiaceae bacterium]|nr:TRAP transporter substrate-binding protein [Devosiaceae bacterium MH13]